MKYKNPRNLCSGTVRQLDSRVTAGRNVKYIVFALVSAQGAPEFALRSESLNWVRSLGFETVEHLLVRSEEVPAGVARFEEAISGNEFPSDGLVLQFNDISYGASLGRTAKFPRDSIAFKWADETAETTLREIFWSPSRTGLINPVAVFDPVELEGTTVSRASVHNISIMEEMKLGIGDTIRVYKANMIIPQIAEDLTASGRFEIPAACPVCGGRTEIREGDNVKSLYCTNPECQAKKIKSYSLFVSRDALNIEGLSESTLEKLIGAGLIHDFSDLFRLAEHRAVICEMEGMGEKSCDKLLAAAEKASVTTLPALIYGLGIEGIGVANAKLLCRRFDQDPDKLVGATEEELTQTEGIGAVLASGIRRYFDSPRNISQLHRLREVLTLEKPERSEQSLAGKTFVITGSLNTFANRNEARDRIEAAGGKVAGSVSAKTDYLVNNDVTSSSSKNKKARELGIPVISEEELLSMLP